MPHYLLLWVILAPVVAIAGAIYLNRLARFHERTISDLAPFFRKLDPDLLEEIFDVETEALAFYHSGNPSRERRRRMELVREYLRRMDHNNRVVLEVANTEYNCMQECPASYNALTSHRITTMRQRAMLFNNCVLFVLAETWFWMLVSSFPRLRRFMPSAARLRYFGKLDLLKAYEQVRAAAVEYARIFGEEYAEEVSTSM